MTIHTVMTIPRDDKIDLESTGDNTEGNGYNSGNTEDNGDTPRV